MVVLARAASHNAMNRMVLYLCAGTIMGATEDCTCGVELVSDGQWHYYLIDLTDTPTWNGTVHSWRFDVLNGPCAEGDYVDIATVQFFRTSAAAQKAAAASTAVCETPYAKGQPAVYADMLAMARSRQQVDAAMEPKEEEPEDNQAVEDTAYFQMRQRITELLSVLPQEDAKLLTLRFGLEGGLPLSPEDAGKQLGLTPQEVVKREANALAKLRQQG